MRWIFATTFFVMLASGFTARGQEGTFQPATVDLCTSCVEPGWMTSSCGPRYWASADYLLWWVKDAPLPLPLVTAGPTSDPVPAAAGQPGTVALFGGRPLDYGTFSGVHVALGAWLDSCQSFGWEASGFLLEKRSLGFTLAGQPSDPFRFGFPIVNAVTGQQQAISPVSSQFLIPPFPATPTSGRVSTFASVRVWGAGTDGVVALARGDRWTIDGLAGFRYADLQEEVGYSPVQDLVILPMNSSRVRGGTDFFGTRNQFYGGEAGVRAQWRGDVLSAGLTAKVALGASHELVDINGVVAQVGTGLVPTFSAVGLHYAQQTSIGRQAKDRFAVVPEVELRVGYQVTEAVRATLGYSFFYWSSVVRPGDQIDHVVNVSQFDNRPVVGAARPMPLFNETTFWAQGISFGLEFTF